MKIDGFEYRFIHVPDPPFEYGFGLDDPDDEYWITPRYLSRPTRVWKRSMLPREDGKPVFPWLVISRENFPGLFGFGDRLAEWGKEGGMIKTFTVPVLREGGYPPFEVKGRCHRSFRDKRVAPRTWKPGGYCKEPVRWRFALPEIEVEWQCEHAAERYQHIAGNGDVLVVWDEQGNFSAVPWTYDALCIAAAAGYKFAAPESLGILDILGRVGEDSQWETAVWVAYKIIDPAAGFPNGYEFYAVCESDRPIIFTDKDRVAPEGRRCIICPET